MKKYYFYSATGSGMVSLQFPPVASSVGVAQDGKIYQVKLTPGATLTTVVPGQTMTEAALISAITTAFSGAKVMVDEIAAKNIYQLN